MCPGPRSILLIRLSAMGDVVMASALIPVLRRRYPGVQLSWLVQLEFADLLRTTRFDSSEHLTEILKRYVQVYNQLIPQKALGHIPPSLEKLVPKQPNLFNKSVYNLTGLNRLGGSSRTSNSSITPLGCAGGHC